MFRGCRQVTTAVSLAAIACAGILAAPAGAKVQGRASTATLVTATSDNRSSIAFLPWGTVKDLSDYSVSRFYVNRDGSVKERLWTLAERRAGILPDNRASRGTPTTHITPDGYSAYCDIAVSRVGRGDFGELTGNIESWCSWIHQQRHYASFERSSWSGYRAYGSTGVSDYYPYTHLSTSWWIGCGTGGTYDYHLRARVGVDTWPYGFGKTGPASSNNCGTTPPS